MNNPIDLLTRELNRLDNDLDRLQMLTTLKSRLNHVTLTDADLNEFLSMFRNDEIRCRANDLLKTNRIQMKNSSSNISKVQSNSSGVFEKAKQFVCRVFAGVTAIGETAEEKQIETISLSSSTNDLSLTPSSPPPSPIRSDQLDQIHAILDNIDSVLDKIEAQAQSARHNENIDQDTQTNFDVVERNQMTTSDGSGDQNSTFIDLFD